ncbi:MAG TPA: PPC domain-containing DNA-binding protein [Candidatus Saccharimonadales bacterium]|nr:PPC domain-containing DNA-binding protein [Candidatus Saccharimonadales bacterium]
MIIHTFRIKPGNDLKAKIEQFVQAHNIRAGFVITCVGGVNKAVLRSADIAPNKQDLLTFQGKNDNNFEITSLVGTVSVNGSHLHMSIADTAGNGFGGHLKEGTIVYPTAEIVLGEHEQVTYTRELDETTGYNELVVSVRQPAD